MKFGRTFKELCTPARVYFLISVITIIIGLFNQFHFIALLIKAGFVLAWTYILNLLCKKGLKAFSWFLVLLPFFLMFIGFFMSLTNVREGFKTAIRKGPTKAEVTARQEAEKRAVEKRAVEKAREAAAEKARRKNSTSPK